MYFNAMNVDGLCFTCPNRGKLCELCAKLFQNTTPNGRLIKNEASPESVAYMKKLMEEEEHERKASIMNTTDFRHTFEWTPLRKQIFLYLIQYGPCSRYQVSTELGIPRSTAFDNLMKIETAGFIKHYNDSSYNSVGRPQVLWSVIKL